MTRASVQLLAIILMVMLFGCQSIPTPPETEPAALPSISSTEPSARTIRDVPEGECIFIPDGSPISAAAIQDGQIFLSIYGTDFTIVNAQGQMLTCWGPYLEGDMEVFGYYQNSACDAVEPLDLIVPYSESFTITLGTSSVGMAVSARDYYGYVRGQGIETVTISSCGASAVSRSGEMYVRTLFSSTGSSTPEFWIDGDAASEMAVTYAGGKYQVSGYTGEAAVGTGRFSLDSATTFTIQGSTVFSVQEDVPAVVSST